MAATIDCLFNQKILLQFEAGARQVWVETLVVISGSEWDGSFTLTFAQRFFTAFPEPSLASPRPRL
jgi:hypothetical protein